MDQRTPVLTPVSQYQPETPLLTLETLVLILETLVLTLNHPCSCPWQQRGSCMWQPRDHHSPSPSLSPPRATVRANRAPLDCWKKISREFCREVGEGTPRTGGPSSALLGGPHGGLLQWGVGDTPRL
ncbi:unnamed protein product [Coccothraustes coccothraustes]